eukprot:m.90502 g.90502  ORF g.90502 m.90502 type:complete len:310 (-) comp16462_c0_seq1:502-1431(-)
MNTVRFQAKPLIAIGTVTIVCVVWLSYGRIHTYEGAATKSPHTVDLGEHEMHACPIPASAGGGTVQERAYKDSNAGVVVSVSGRRHQDMEITIRNIARIRRVFKEPISVQLWFLGDAEAYSDAVKELLCDLGGVSVYDLSKYTSCVKYYCKVDAMYYSTYDKMILLDANAMLLQAPSVFLDLLHQQPSSTHSVEHYDDVGVYLFRDYTPCFSSLSRLYTEWVFGVDGSEMCNAGFGQEIDSSCIVLDRKIAQASMALTKTYRHNLLVGVETLGDKKKTIIIVVGECTRKPRLLTFDACPYACARLGTCG